MTNKSNHKDITGRKSGTLTALYRTAAGATTWLCSCDCGCGKTKVVESYRFIPSINLTCRTRIRKSCKNFIKKGYRHCWLTVTKRAPDKIRKDGRIQICWHCKCDCGGHIIVEAERLYESSLSSKKTAKTCGCGLFVARQFHKVIGLDDIPVEERRKLVELCKLRSKVLRKYQLIKKDSKI